MLIGVGTANIDDPQLTVRHVAGPSPARVVIDPSGRLLVAANIVDMRLRDGDSVSYVPAALSVFRVGADGKLDFVRKYDVELGGKFQWWAGMVRLPAA